MTGDSVRLRSQPSTDSEEIGVLNQGDTLEILDSSNDTWYQVSYTDSDGEQLSGYVSRDLVTIGTTAGSAAVNSAGVTRTATLTEGGVNLRNEASTDSSVLTQIDAGSVVTILDDSLEGWIQVGYSDGTSNYTGYISSDYLYVNPMAVGVTTVPPLSCASRRTATATSLLCFRRTPRWISWTASATGIRSPTAR